MVTGMGMILSSDGPPGGDKDHLSRVDLALRTTFTGPDETGSGTLDSMVTDPVLSGPVTSASGHGLAGPGSRRAVGLGRSFRASDSRRSMSPTSTGMSFQSFSTPAWVTW